METPSTGPIPRTPIRLARGETLRSIAEELERSADGEPGAGTEEEADSSDEEVVNDDTPRYVPVKYLTDHFRNKQPYSFTGADKYKQGKLFIARFEGEVRCSGVLYFKDALLGGPVFATHNDTIYQALLQLTSEAAVEIVLRYDGDGVAAYRALRRAIFKTQTATQTLGALKSTIANYRVPGDRDPSSSLSTLQSLQREKAALVNYDTSEQLADIILALPVEYALPAQAVTPDTDPDTLIANVLVHFENYLRHASKKRSALPGVAAIDDGGKTNNRSGGGGRGKGGRHGRGGGSSSRGGTGGRGGGNADRPPPTTGCLLCGGSHWLKSCPQLPRAKAAVGSVAAVTTQPTAVSTPTVGADASESISGPTAPEANVLAISVEAASTDMLVDHDHIVCAISACRERHDLADIFWWILLVLLLLLIGGLCTVIGVYALYTLRPVFAGKTAVRHHHHRVGAVEGLKSFNIDSGATVHVCNNSSWFDELTRESIPISAVAPGTTFAAGTGTVTFRPSDRDGQIVPIVLNNVLFIPNQPHNVISAARLEDAGFVHRADLDRGQASQRNSGGSGVVGEPAYGLGHLGALGSARAASAVM